uniref:Hypothetical 5K protein (kan region) n=1 Tax=Streptomyces griseus TaxID=1911 RepID=Q7M0K4_STRGR
MMMVPSPCSGRQYDRSTSARPDPDDSSRGDEAWTRRNCCDAPTGP